MLKRRIGTPSHVNQHVIVKITNLTKREGFEYHDMFSIKDINPDNNPGQPKYEVFVLGSYFEEGIEDKPHIDSELFSAAMIQLTDFLKEKKKGEKKVNIMIATKAFIETDYLTALYLLGKSLDNDFNITVFMDTEDMLKAEKLEYAIGNIKNFVKEAGGTECLGSAYQTGMLDIYQEAITKRTIPGIKKDLTGKKVVIIDTHNFYYRNYFGMPAMHNTEGVPTSVVKALTTMLKGLVKDKPDYIVFASEDKTGVKQGVRYRLYDQYKANREETEADLKTQITMCENLLEKMGFKIVSERGFEADDVVGSYTRYFEDLGAEVYIHTTDKDMYQLISDKVKIYNPMKNILIGEEECREKFLVNPEKVVYSLALAGDTSDNVPGVKGIGPKKAAALITQYGTLEDIYKNVESLTGAVKKNIEENKVSAFISLELVRIYDFLAKDVNLYDHVFPKYDIFGTVAEDLSKLEITV